MRIELLPLIAGIPLALIGILLIADAWMPDDMFVPHDRRRRPRAERHRLGEALVGAGTLAMAAALMGRDVWRYGTLAVLFGAILLVAGIVLNRHYLRENVFFRAAARRTAEGSPVPPRDRAAAAKTGRESQPATSTSPRAPITEQPAQDPTPSPTPTPSKRLRLR